MPATYPAAAALRAKPKRNVNSQATAELTFRVSCLYAAVGISDTKALLRAVSGKPHHDFSAIIDHLLETCSELFLRRCK